jgi:hypothetical protein
MCHPVAKNGTDSTRDGLDPSLFQLHLFHFPPLQAHRPPPHISHVLLIEAPRLPAHLTHHAPVPATSTRSNLQSSFAMTVKPQCDRLDLTSTCPPPTAPLSASTSTTFIFTASVQCARKLRAKNTCSHRPSRRGGSPSVSINTSAYFLRTVKVRASMGVPSDRSRLRATILFPSGCQIRGSNYILARISRYRAEGRVSAPTNARKRVLICVDSR